MSSASAWAHTMDALRQAAERGEAWAQFSVGASYEQGEDVPRDYEKALQWYRKAAEQNYPPALRALGDMYYTGRGVGLDGAVAAQWYKKAAFGGDSDAQVTLGSLYAIGMDVPLDYQEAYVWLSLAVDQGHNEAVFLRRMLRRVMSSKNLARARELVRLRRQEILSKQEANK